MNTIVYLIRHSKSLNMKVKNLNYNDSLQVKNEKNGLSVEGEKRAQTLSKIAELRNIDIVIASKYVRAIATAKYIADENNLELFVDEDFGERKFGVQDYSDIPSDFGQKQFENEDYKIADGESLREVSKRMIDKLMKIIHENSGKRIVIVSHSTALLSLFKKIGNVKDGELYIHDTLLFDKNYIWNAPELFKLEFNDKELVSISNIRNIHYES